MNTTYRGQQPGLRPFRGRYFLALITIVSLMLPTIAQSALVVDEGSVGGSGSSELTMGLRYPSRCRDTITCELPTRLQNIDQFLRGKKVGLFTPDSRPLTPTIEVLRLNVVPQALGYLNLYHSTGNSKYRSEALDRLQYILRAGPAVYGSGVRTGMFGHALLLGYEYTGIEAYKTEGLRIADECLVQPTGDLWMNGGLMCGFNLAQAYRLTGRTEYQTAARAIIERTSVWQYANGVFPHQPHPGEGNTNYTAWMVTELLLMRQSDPGYELNDLLLAKAMQFLSERVNSDGSINYTDANGVYYLDPLNLDSRYWTGELASIALDLSAGGRRDQANQVLKFLFKHEMTGSNRGGYPDKYNLEGVTSDWETGRPSVIRTSLIFWYLSMIGQFSQPCSGGGTTACTVNPLSCSSLYQSIGQCNQYVPGIQTCLAGTYTSCFAVGSTHFSGTTQCLEENYCVDDPMYGACYHQCYRTGQQLCVNGVCAGMCYAIQEGDVQCDVDCFPNAFCSENGVQTLSSGRQFIYTLALLSCSEQ